MKSLIFCTLFLVGAIGLSAQSTIPTAVQDAFAQKFPYAQEVSWEAEEDGYEASFQMEKLDFEALFSPTGQWLETEMEIQVSALPASVTESLNQNYGSYKILEAQKISTPTQAIAYEVELGKGKKVLEVSLTPEGEVFEEMEEMDDDQ